MDNDEYNSKYRPLVYHMWGKYFKNKYNHIEVSEFESLAYIALTKALEKVDPAKGKLSTILYYKIWHEVQKHFEEMGYGMKKPHPTKGKDDKFPERIYETEDWDMSMIADKQVFTDEMLYELEMMEDLASGTIRI
jgi:DNA-directed RNA polymerase specialized sigma subunit